jgi:hypothetical protein
MRPDRRSFANGGCPMSDKPACVAAQENHQLLAVVGIPPGLYAS